MKLSQSRPKIHDKKQTLLNIQKNEKLRILLLNKFKMKYKSKLISDNIILQEIDIFMEIKDLTINNLRELDREIMLAINKPRGNYQLEPINKYHQKGNLANNISEKKLLRSSDKGISSTQKHIKSPEFRTLKNPETKGVKKEVEILKPTEIEQGQPIHVEEPVVEMKLPDDQDHIPLAKEVPLDDEEEWNSFQKFKNKLYEEELKQDAEKKRDNIIFMREQLEKQLQEKDDIKMQKKKEEEAYAENERQILDKMNEKEHIRVQEQKEKAENERKNRLDQIKKVTERKQNELNLQKEEDKKLVDRIRQEQVQEKEFMQYKKYIAKETLIQMMEDTIKNRQKQKDEIAQEKINDVRAQQLYKELLDRQDEERAAYFKSKDEMNSKMVNEIAKAVIEKQKEREKFEDDMHKRIEKKKELKERRAEEMRRKIDLQSKVEMRDFLAKQLEEKRLQKEQEKAENAEQRRIWLNQQKESEEFEKKRAHEIFELNKSNQMFLDKQKDELKLKQKKMPLSQAQFLMNKNLFDDAKKKLEAQYLEGEEGEEVKLENQ